MTHPAWAPAEPEWVQLAPGVRWLLQRPDGVTQRVVAAEVASVMSRVFHGRAALEELGLDLDDDHPDSVRGLDLDRLHGYASVLAAVFTAQRCLKGWEGIDDPRTAEPLDHTDPEAIRAALIHGAPPQGQSLLAPFMSWVEQPKVPMASEAIRLRKRAKDWWGGGRERCLACQEDAELCSKGASAPKAEDPTKREICPQLDLAPLTPAGRMAWTLAATTPGLWERGGMAAAITGLKHGDALLAYEAQCARGSDAADHGAAFEAFRAIEAGVLEAMADRVDPAKAEAG